MQGKNLMAAAAGAALSIAAGFGAFADAFSANVGASGGRYGGRMHFRSDTRYLRVTKGWTGGGLERPYKGSPAAKKAARLARKAAKASGRAARARKAWRCYAAGARVGYITSPTSFRSA